MKEPSERYGTEPFRASGKRSPLRDHTSVAPATQEPLATDPQPERIKGHTRRLVRAIVRTRVQRACPPPRRSKLRSLRFRPDGENCVSLRCIESLCYKGFSVSELCRFRGN